MKHGKELWANNARTEAQSRRDTALNVLLLALHVPFPEAKYLGETCSSTPPARMQLRRMQSTARRTPIASAARTPTSSQLGVGALSCDSDADGCVGVVAVVILAALAGAVEAEAPASLVAIVALDVEARPRESVRNRSSRGSSRGDSSRSSSSNSSSRNSQSNKSRNNICQGKYSIYVLTGLCMGQSW